ncbi:hypothetical protein AB832_07930 [Flavobacteriaceae bacterium (ex Bugula neritina AB1)]|nr:hypothetical protein AB832_07930 [Flavobacteriaceae bacterium (ex Bugula neritina AB1)]
MIYPENNKLPEKQNKKLTIDEIEDLIKTYERKHIGCPTMLVKSFKSKQEFRQWCKEGSKEDLEATLKAFEEAELYEYCVVINEVKNSK